MTSQLPFGNLVSERRVLVKRLVFQISYMKVRDGCYDLNLVSVNKPDGRRKRKSKVIKFYGTSSPGAP